MGLIRHKLQQLKFLIGEDPVIEHTNCYRAFIPEPYKTVICISADFELAWAGRYSKSTSNPLVNALGKARIERSNIPLILALLDMYSIPVTWLIVGHLFLYSCNRINGKAHVKLPRIIKYENEFWKFDGEDWFENDPCSNYKDAPEWYCPDLIQLILDARVKHEIGCHTFSHIDCRDEVCQPEVLNAELDECKKLADLWGINLKSFVHPAHTIGNLDILADHGFTNFRTDFKNVLGYPKKHSNGLWEFQQTMELRYYDYWSIDYQIKRYITIVKRAMNSNTLCIFWFHPSVNTIFIEKIWPVLSDFIVQNKQKIWVTTHSEYINRIRNEA